MVRKKANMTVEHIMIERTISVTNDPFIEINGGVNGTCVSKSCWYTKRVLRAEREPAITQNYGIW